MLKEPWDRVLRGKHVYGMHPEDETAVARECFAAGVLVGLGLAGLIGWVVASHLPW